MKVHLHSFMLELQLRQQGDGRNNSLNSPGSYGLNCHNYRRQTPKPHCYHNAMSPHLASTIFNHTHKHTRRDHISPQFCHFPTAKTTATHCQIIFDAVVSRCRRLAILKAVCFSRNRFLLDRLPVACVVTYFPVRVAAVETPDSPATDRRTSSSLS